MVQVIETEIEIDAPVERVWATFSDFGAWPQWNPFVVRLAGDVAVGERIEVRLAPPGGRAMTLRPRVVAYEPDQELRWLGNLLLPGIFDGAHQFLLEAIDEHRTRFTQREEFRGMLVGLLLRSIRQRTTDGFEAMNEALKRRVEAAGGSGT